jgi:amino-acid N-acetyltransferase
MAVSIRRASETDKAEIESLVRSAAVNPRDIRWWRFLVAEEGGLIVGIQQLRTHGGGTREVATRVVRSEFRRRGIGAELLRALLVDQSGPLYLQCGENAAPYYERFGFYRVEPSTLPADFRREHRIGRFFVALRSLAVRRRLSIVPMKRDAVSETRSRSTKENTKENYS